MFRVSNLLFLILIVMAYLGQPLIALSSPCKDMEMRTMTESYSMGSVHDGHIQQVRSKNLTSECCIISTCGMNSCLHHSQEAITFSLSPQAFKVQNAVSLALNLTSFYSNFETNSLFRPPISLITV
ncbi:hypothetical protein MAMP_00191 [Methylophaga aminisulfidivorans MP]|uniref:Uncharacterized protein n=1 Tax=Methylophaga aminisulfidivorans MP TaxID=1026882 RepID=F5T0S9_9GAMM|nr:hypothetical protein MAMP_00191 [Methylophaga aminisulfidivorans MP]